MRSITTRKEETARLQLTVVGMEPRDALCQKDLILGICPCILARTLAAGRSLMAVFR